MTSVNQIKFYREQLGLSQIDLAQHIRVTRQTIAAWEKGDREPSLSQLLAISKVMGISMEVLLGESVFSHKPNILFRADKPSELTLSRRDILSSKAFQYSEIEALVGELAILPPQYPTDEYNPNLVEQIAKDIRNWLGIGQTAPLGNVLNLLESKGIKIILCDLPDKISGFSAYTDSLGGIIFVNKNHPPQRQYFTALHELAHLIFHRHEYKISQERSSKKDPREKAANHLAGAILLPDFVIHCELEKYKNKWIPDPLLIDIKSRYWVSIRTVLIRAEQIGLISKRQLGQQLGLINKKYGYNREPGEIATNKNLNRLERLVYLALLQNKISFIKASEILGESVKNIQSEYSDWEKRD